MLQFAALKKVALQSFLQELLLILFSRHFSFKVNKL